MGSEFDDFEDDFDIPVYLQKSYSNPTADSRTFPKHMRHFLLTRWQEFFADRAKNFPRNNASILEFGGGPVIAPLISAVPIASRIVFSDYCSDGRESVRLWKDNGRGAHDWSPFFEHIVRNIEHVTGENAARDRQTEMKGKITEILHGDAMKSSPLGEGFDRSFDIVSMSFVLESACRSIEDIDDAVVNISTMLKPGGWIRINGVFGGSWYTIMEKKFFNVTQTEADLRNSLSIAGFRDIDIQMIYNIRPSETADYKGYYHVSAQLA